MQQLDQLMSTIDEKEGVILMGDINEHAPNSSVNQLLSQHGFIQLINQPTTIHSNKKILDHCYIRKIHCPLRSGVLPIYYSFHEGIYVVSEY